MWYRGSHYEVKTRKMRHDEEVACYAESKDGIHWTRPELGLVEFEGSKRNNIFWTQKMTRHEPGVLPPDMPPIPFRDSNPAAHESERFKAMSGTNEAGLYAGLRPTEYIGSRSDRERYCVKNSISTIPRVPSGMSAVASTWRTCVTGGLGESAGTRPETCGPYGLSRPMTSVTGRSPSGFSWTWS